MKKEEEKGDYDFGDDINIEDSDDSSDEEVLIRTGNVPLKWYDNYDHIGYSVDAAKVIKEKGNDELEEFIRRKNDKNWWLRIKDVMNNKNVTLTKEDMELLERIRSRKFAETTVDPYDVIHSLTY